MGLGSEIIRNQVSSGNLILYIHTKLKSCDAKEGSFVIWLEAMKIIWVARRRNWSTDMTPYFVALHWTLSWNICWKKLVKGSKINCRNTNSNSAVELIAEGYWPATWLTQYMGSPGLALNPETVQARRWWTTPCTLFYERSLSHVLRANSAGGLAHGATLSLSGWQEVSLCEGTHPFVDGWGWKRPLGVICCKGSQLRVWNGMIHFHKCGYTLSPFSFLNLSISGWKISIF